MTWTRSPRFSRRWVMAVTDRHASTDGRSLAPHPGRGKSWVLAMLAPKGGLRVAPVPPKTADLTRPARGRRDNGRSGRRNRRFDRTKEQPRTSWPCRHHHPSLTVYHPMVGETENASHTEIRTLPPAAEICAVYRPRWQIELAFKRLKSLIGIDRIPTRTVNGGLSWLYPHLILALLTGDIFQEILESSPCGPDFFR